MNNVLDSFDLKVSIDPAKDVLSREEVRAAGSLCRNCPVAKAIRRAVKPRFRRWNFVTASVGTITAEIDLEVGGRALKYRASLPGNLRQQRSLYDFLGPGAVKAATAVVTFNRKS